MKTSSYVSGTQFLMLPLILLSSSLFCSAAPYDTYDISPYGSHNYDRHPYTSAVSREYKPKISRIYHYDNLTDCEAACEVKCEATQVIRNDVEERQQYSCKQRKPPLVNRLVDLSSSGTMSVLVVAAVLFIGLIMILCCCCCRCCRLCCNDSKKQRTAAASAKSSRTNAPNSSNDPLVDNGEFREVLDSKDIGYLKREVI